MTVSQLIKHLETCDPDAVVAVLDHVEEGQPVSNVGPSEFKDWVADGHPKPMVPCILIS